MVSAVQVDGQRLHELARQGIEVDRKPAAGHGPLLHGRRARRRPGSYPIEVTCSSGTYIRSLAADIGTALGGGAHLRDLRRTAIGSFTVDEAVAIEDLTPDHLLTPAQAMRDLTPITVDGDVVTAVGHGKQLPARGARGQRPGPVGRARRRRSRSSPSTSRTAPARPSRRLCWPPPAST